MKIKHKKGIRYKKHITIWNDLYGFQCKRIIYFTKNNKVIKRKEKAKLIK